MITDNQPSYFDVDESIFTNVVPKDLSDSDIVGSNNNIILDTSITPGVTPIEDKQDTSSTDTKSSQDNNKPDSTDSIEQKNKDQSKVDDSKSNNSTDNDFSDYSQPALFAQLLAENNLNFFGDEIPKDLNPIDFVQKFSESTNAFISTVINNKLQEMGSIADYIQFRLNGGSNEAIDPILEIDRVAGFNIDDANVTEDDLVKVVSAMYENQNIPKHLIPNLIKVDKENGVLDIRAKESVDFHKKYKDDLFTKAKQDYDDSIRAEQYQKKLEENAFATKLKETEKIGTVLLTDVDRAEIFDYHHKRDQLVKYKDDDGNIVSDYVTKYELDMYQAVNDPDKLIKLTYFLKHGFDLSSDSKIVSNLKKDANASLLRAIEGNKFRVDNTSMLKNNNNASVSREDLIADIDIRH